jgi:hypothetical protein
VAGCVTGTTPTLGGPSATGIAHGWCGLSVGSGAVTGGGSFSWIGIGGVLVVTGEVNGVVYATPDLVSGDSCLTSGADDFIVTGAAARASCLTATSVPVSVLPVSVSWSIWTAFHFDAHVHPMQGSVHACVPV